MNDKIEIKPTAVYTAEEAAKLVGVDKRTIYSRIESNELKAISVGRGYKVLGENLLRYLGSAVYQAPSQPTPSYEAGQPLTSNKDGN